MFYMSEAYKVNKLVFISSLFIYTKRNHKNFNFAPYSSAWARFTYVHIAGSYICVVIVSQFLV